MNLRDRITQLEAAAQSQAQADDPRYDLAVLSVGQLRRLHVLVRQNETGGGLTTDEAEELQSLLRLCPELEYPRR